MRRIYTLLIMTIVTTFIYGFTVDGINYSLSNNQAVVEGLADKAYSGELVIPDNVVYNGETYPVTSIFNGAFEDCTEITSVHIPESVTYIGIWAFKGCSKLASFTIPNSVTKVGYDAFTNTAWYDSQPDGLLYKDHILLGYNYNGSKPEGHIEIENGTRVIAFGSMGSCPGIISVSIPNTIKEIGYMTFWKCESLTSINIPSSITTIEAGAFGYCSNLTSIYFDNTAPILFKADPFCDGPFCWCEKLSSIYIKDLSVWCRNTFEDSRSTPFLMSLISDELTHFFVGEKEIIDLVIPDGVSSINQLTFYNCKSIRSVTISNSVKAIGYRAFGGCNSLKEVYSLISEPFALDGAFSIKDDATLYVPVGTKAMYEATDGWKDFKNIVEMTPYDVLDDNTVAAHFLQPDEEGKVEIPATVEIDGKTYTVTEIAADAFKDNKELKEVTIPGTVTKIGDGAFAGCENLRAIYVFASEPISLTAAEARSTVTRATENVPSQLEGIDFEACTLYVPIGSEQKYREAEGWKLFTHIVGVADPSGITTIRTEQEACEAVYNLSGQRLATPLRGLNIIGGKKVVVK